MVSFECKADERERREVCFLYSDFKAINIDASQIAKDLSYVDIAGRTRVGYDIDLLIQVLEDFFGIYQYA